MKKNIDNELLTICKEIQGYNHSPEEWSEVESCDMFQSEHYCGGFEADEEAFWFSYYDDNDNEFYFKITLNDVNEILNGKLNNITLKSTE